MSDLDLDAIRARCNKATAGPWNAKANLSGHCYGLDWHERFSAFSVAPHIASGTRGGNPGDDGLAQAGADAEFIAQARSDVPLLVAEVDRLRADLATAKAEAAREIAEAIEAEPDFYQKSYWAGINRGALIARGIAVGYARILAAGGTDPTGGQR